MKRTLFSAALAAVLLPCAAQAATHEVAALSDLAGVNKALRVKPGDTVSLPALAEGSYKVTNARYATLAQDGSTLEILEPGMLGVQQLAADGELTKKSSYGKYLLKVAGQSLDEG